MEHKGVDGRQPQVCQTERDRKDSQEKYRPSSVRLPKSHETLSQDARPDNTGKIDGETQDLENSIALIDKNFSLY